MNGSCTGDRPGKCTVNPNLPNACSPLAFHHSQRNVRFVISLLIEPEPGWVVSGFRILCLAKRLIPLDARYERVSEGNQVADMRLVGGLIKGSS